ncbi:MAG TPA: hypothetical protein VJV03_14715, partial [Pyrinomonadaceae bacterium]|nr:hypothetical protein [Pyrinomonadaceae bacterium]
MSDGKAEPFRTGCGKAAVPNQTDCQASVILLKICPNISNIIPFAQAKENLMKKCLALALVCLALAVSAVQTARSQSADQPTLQKDSLQVTAWTRNVYKENYDVWSWVPKFEFRVNGPIASGSQLFVEVQQPGGSAPWLSFDCDTGEIQKGYWWKTECGGRQIEDKSITAVGPVNFSIKMRNELAGGNTTLFTGKMKVAKTLSNEHRPKAVNKFVYYVDHDWNLPIGYIWYTPDSVYAWEYPTFNIGFWVRGDAYKLDPHLFYKGQEIGRLFMDGMQVGKGGCNTPVENNTTHSVNDGMPQKAKWARVECSFPVV